MFVYLFPVPLSPICKRHCLSVESHLSVTKDCFLLKHFYLDSSRVVCLKTKAVEKNAHYLQPLYVVTYIMKCST